MTALQATVEVFWTAYKALPKGAQGDFLDRLVVDRRARRELEDRFDNGAVDRALREPGRVSWQANERAVERNKKRGRVIGDGTMRDLTKALGLRALYRKLPPPTCRKALRQIHRLSRNLHHPSLQVKKIQGTLGVWEARVDI